MLNWTYFLVVIYSCCYLKIQIVFGEIPECYFGHKSKCLLTMINRIGGDVNDNLTPIQNHYVANENQCTSLCIQHELCFMVGYTKNISQCLLYTTINFTINTHSATTIFAWECCTSNYVIPRRCSGYYEHADDYILVNSSWSPLLIMENSQLLDCKLKCAQHNLCGGFNYFHANSTCQLLIQFPVNNTKMIPATNIIAFLLRCSPNYHLPNPTKNCQQKEKSGEGYFTKESDSALLNFKKFVIYFYTIYWKDCLDNCLLYQDCIGFWYNLFRFICILESRNNSLCAEPLNGLYHNVRFARYKWNQCKLKSNISSPVMIKGCRTIKSNKYLWIYKVKCGEMPIGKQVIKKCYNGKYFIQSVVTMHCLKFQSYRVIKYIQSNSSAIQQYGQNFSQVNWALVSNNYELYWLINVTDDNFQLAHQEECQLFNGDYRNLPDNISMITRQQWNNLPPRYAQKIFQSPVKKAIITTTLKPQCSCFSEVACSDGIRWQLKEMYDNNRHQQLPYNFVISGNGLIFQGKGWDYQAENCLEENFQTLSVALIGEFSHNLPFISQIQSLNTLLKVSVKENKLITNYNLLPRSDTGHESIQTGLITLLAELPGFREHRRALCPAYSLEIIIVNICTVLIFCLVTIWLIHNFYKRLFHNQLCFPIRQFKIECLFVSSDKQTFDKDFILENFPRIICLNYLSYLSNIHLSSFLTNVIWIENRQTLNVPQCNCRKCFTAIFNMKRSRTHSLDIHSIIQLTKEQISCNKSSIIASFNHDLNSLLVLHFSNPTTSVNHLLEMICKNDCCCINFNIYSINYSDKYFGKDLDVISFTDPFHTTTRTELQNKFVYCLDKNKIIKYCN